MKEKSKALLIDYIQWQEVRNGRERLPDWIAEDIADRFLVTHPPDESFTKGELNDAFNAGLNYEYQEFEQYYKDKYKGK